MANPELDRVRRDLEVMNQALGTELPSVSVNWKSALLDALIVVPLALWSTVGPGTHMSLVLVVTLVALAVADIRQWKAYRRQRAEHPARWREWRLQMVVSLAAAPPVLLLFYWAVVNGAPPQTMVGLVLAVAGGIFVGMGCFAVIRRSYIPLGLAMIACGLAMPWCNDRQVGLGFALMFFVGALAGEAVAAWELRQAEHNHGTG